MNVQAPARREPVKDVVEPQHTAECGTSIVHLRFGKCPRRFHVGLIDKAKPRIEITREDGWLVTVEQVHESARLPGAAVLCPNPRALCTPHIVEVRRNQ